MRIQGKKLGFNSLDNNIFVDNISSETINDSIFILSNSNEPKLYGNKNDEDLNNRIMQVKEYTVNEVKKEFKNKPFKYSNIMDEVTFYKVLDEYLTSNLNSMVFYTSKDKANFGQDNYDTVNKILTEFVNKLKSLDGDIRSQFYERLADAAVKAYSKKLFDNIQNSIPSNSPLVPQIKFDTNDIEKQVVEEEQAPLEPSLTLLLLQLNHGLLEQEELNNKIINLLDIIATNDTTEMRRLLPPIETHDLNFLRKTENSIQERVNINYYSEENLKKIYPDTQYTVISSYDTQEQSSIESIQVFNNKTGKVVYRAEKYKDNNQTVMLKLTKNDDNGYGIYNADYDSNGKFTDKYLYGIQEYTCNIQDILEEKRKLFGEHSSNEELENLIYQLDADYVIEVLEEYEYDDALSTYRNNRINHRNEAMPNSLIKDIFAMRRVSNASKYDLAKHVIDKLVKKARLEGVYIDDIVIPLYKELDKQNSCRKMDSSEIDRYMTHIYMRIKDYKLDEEPISTSTLKYMKKEVPAPNGKIDEKFRQGNMGDCWLIATIKSAIRNDSIKTLLDDFIEVLPNGDMKVTLKGVDMSYIIPESRLYTSDYADGELDVRGIEIAVEKYEHTINGDLTGIYGGTARQACDVLFGVKSKYVNLKNRNFLEKILFSNKRLLNKITSGKYLIIGGVSEKTDIMATNDNGEKVELLYPHGYSISNADNKYVYFTDPHDKEGTLKMTHDEFFEAFSDLSFAKISKIQKSIKKYDKKHKI